jgi:hypothetical protein
MEARSILGVPAMRTTLLDNLHVAARSGSRRSAGGNSDASGTIRSEAGPRRVSAQLHYLGYPMNFLQDDEDEEVFEDEDFDEDEEADEDDLEEDDEDEEEETWQVVRPFP